MTAPAAHPDTPRRFGKIAKQGILWSFFREGVSEMITTPTALVMARLLTPFDFGIAALATFFLSLSARLTNVGFNQALVREKHLRDEHCSSVFVAMLALGVGVYAVLFAASGPLAIFFRTPELKAVLRVASLSFLISPIGAVPAALMARHLQFKRTAACDWAGGLTEAGSAIVLAWFGYGFWSIVYARLAGQVVLTSAKVTLGLRNWRPSVRFSWVALRELLPFGMGVFAKRLLDYSASNLDNLVVGRLLGATTLGFYDKAFVTVDKVLGRINTGGPAVSFRVFAVIHEDRERFRAAYRRVVLAVACVSFPILIGLAAAAPELVTTMYGQRWISAVVPFQILCLAGVFKVANEYAGSAAQAVGQIWSQVWRQAVYAALVVVAVAALSPWGVQGAALGVLVATIAMSLLMHGLLMRITGMSAADILLPQVPGVIAALAVGAAMAAARAAAIQAHLSGPATLVSAAAAGVVAYGAFMKFNRFRDVRVLLRDAADDLGAPIGSIARLFA